MAGIVEDIKKNENAIDNINVDDVIGIDLGCNTSVVATCNMKSLRIDIARNDLSHQETPMLVSFAAGHRSFGDVAKQLRTTNKDITFNSNLKQIEKFYDGVSDNERIVNIGGKEITLRVEELIGTAISKLTSFGNKAKSSPVSLCIPENFNKEMRQAVRDSALLAGINLKMLVSNNNALITEYCSKRPLDSLNGNVVMIVDVGYTYTNACVFKVDGKNAIKLSSGCLEGVGGEAIDLLIHKELSKECLETKGNEIPINSKGYLRLMNQVVKLKETLSAVEKSSISVESLFEDQDVLFNYTRAQLDKVCEPLSQKLTHFIQEIYNKIEEEDKKVMKTCEIIGGAARIPFIKQAILDGVQNELVLGYTVDSMAAPAAGAALALAQTLQPTGMLSRPIFDTLAILKTEDEEHSSFSEEMPDNERSGFLLSREEIDKCIEQEEFLQQVDDKFEAFHNIKNKVESKVFSTRGLADSHGPHNELIDKELCRKLADELEEWLYNWEEGGGAHPETTLEVYVAKNEEFEKLLEPATAEYNIKNAQDEKELQEKLAKEYAEEQKAKADNPDDYDNRKLKKEDRMHKIDINKNEGTSLFKDGNIDAAVERWLRALQHVEKLDLCPDIVEEDKHEKKSLQLSILLNVTQGNLKMKKFKEASKWAKKVLDIDSNSVKGLYRLAFAQENLRKFDEAKETLAKAKTLAPEDKAIAQLINRVEQQIKREKVKQKKMAQKMFG